MSDAPQIDRIVFLPGAAGDGGFWAPVSAHISASADKVLVTWPGFAGTKRDPNIGTLRDLVPFTERYLDRSTLLVAQSMGGVVAVLTALANTDRVARLVLVATSGGVDMARFGAIDWRPSYLAEQGESRPSWFVDDRTDLTSQLETLAVPTLLIFGDADPIAPVAAGHFLEGTLPRAVLEVIEGGDHDMARKRAGEIAALIKRFLESNDAS